MEFSSNPAEYIQILSFASYVNEIMGIEYPPILQHSFYFGIIKFVRIILGCIMFLMIHRILLDSTQWRIDRAFHSRSNCKHLRYIHFTRNTFSYFCKGGSCYYSFSFAWANASNPMLVWSDIWMHIRHIIVSGLIWWHPKTMIINWKFENFLLVEFVTVAVHQRFFKSLSI